VNYHRAAISSKPRARGYNEQLKSPLSLLVSDHRDPLTNRCSEFGTISTNVIPDTFGIKFKRFPMHSLNVQFGVCGIVLPRNDTDVLQVAMAAIRTELTQPSLVLTGCRRHSNLQTSPGTGEFSNAVTSAPGRFGRLGSLISCRSELSKF
jgi:hypothetical protein